MSKKLVRNRLSRDIYTDGNSLEFVGSPNSGESTEKSRVSPSILAARRQSRYKLKELLNQFEREYEHGKNHSCMKLPLMK